ncbi:MAG: biotin--[acetyl-CoA-carboxylase] ligase [Proteobacteria bacterium]|nr:biotin--[acetyl-CoA-carboxylase] ligase [Pseudomonadota bacterium]
MSLLTADNIREPISGESLSHLDILEVFAEIESTNSFLLDQPCPSPGRYRVALTEHQTAGRGRMGRSWCSPPASGLCMSMAFTFSSMPENFPSLSLAVGIGIVQALERFGIRGISVKWPNDIVARGGKLGGVLSEVLPANAQGVTVVVGIGLNIDLENTDTESRVTSRLGRVVDLASCCDELPSRSVISAALIECLFDTMVRFEADGFSPFYAMWQRYDWLRGLEITIETFDGLVEGVADGIDSDGALLLKTKGELRRFTTGSVTLNGQADGVQ